MKTLTDWVRRFLLGEPSPFKDGGYCNNCGLWGNHAACLGWCICGVANWRPNDQGPPTIATGRQVVLREDGFDLVNHFDLVSQANHLDHGDVPHGDIAHADMSRAYEDRRWWPAGEEQHTDVPYHDTPHQDRV